MRVPRVRVTVGRLMAAVAVVGLGFGAYQMWVRSVAYRATAAEHAGLEEGGRYTARVCRENVAGLGARGLVYLAVGRWRDARGALANAVAFVPLTVRQQRLADYRARMRRKYEHAACYPWLFVEPDPPPPD